MIIVNSGHKLLYLLPLRGKVVNAGKATMKQVIDNTEAQALITAIGAGSGKDFKIEEEKKKFDHRWLRTEAKVMTKLGMHKNNEKKKS